MPKRKGEPSGPHEHDNGHGDKPGHRPHNPPYFDPDYEHPPEHEMEPPDNPRYPDARIYGRYASKRPPR